MNRRIAIVGAGVAGLTCARALRTAGLEVVLFDKARGPGGRLPTRRRERFAFDHGAPFFHVERERFRAEVSDWERAGVVEAWTPRRARISASGARLLAPEPVWVGTPKMSALGRHLSRGLDLRLSRRIVRLEAAGARWDLHADDGSAETCFDGVALTVPPELARDLIADSPALADQVPSEQVAMLPCWCLLLAFGSPFDPGFEVAQFDHPILGQAIRNDAKPGRGPEPVWVVHASEAWSQAVLEDPPEFVGKEIETALRDLLPGLPEVVVRDTHRWRYARAAGSGAGHLGDASRGLWIGGDWTLGPSVEDAFESGLELAAAIAEAPAAPSEVRPSRP